MKWPVAMSGRCHRRTRTRVAYGIPSGLGRRSTRMLARHDGWRRELPGVSQHDTTSSLVFPCADCLLPPNLTRFPRFVKMLPGKLVHAGVALLRCRRGFCQNRFSWALSLFRRRARLSSWVIGSHLGRRPGAVLRGTRAAIDARQRLRHLAQRRWAACALDHSMPPRPAVILTVDGQPKTSC